MPTYPYVHPVTGERREIRAGIRNAPPEEVLIYPDGQWVAAETVSGERAEFYPEDEAKYLYRRDFAAQFEDMHVAVKGDDGITRKAGGVQSVVSKALPLEHEPTEVRSLNGEKVRYNPERKVYSTLRGERIIRNGRDRKEHLKACRMEDCR